MSLSSACLNQHAKEDAIAKQWLLRGLLIAAGAHLGLIPLMAFIPPDAIAPPERIALVVTGPTDPLETPEVSGAVPPEESVEALTEALAQAELATESQISGGSSAPPPPIASFQPAPEPPTASEPVESKPAEVPEPEAEEPSLEPEADEPEEMNESNSSKPEAEKLESDSAESETDSVETAANNAGDVSSTNLNTSDLDALRDRLRRAREREGSASDNAMGTGDTPSAPTGAGTEIARRTGQSAGEGPSTADGDGNSSGSNSGANTVSCRRCDRPTYPEEALDSGAEGSPSVSLEYDRNGKVVGAVLERSSGNAALDAAALDAARNYELDSGGRSGSVSVEIDFGIEGSERSRAARQRGERETVSNPVPAPAPQQEVARDPEPSAPAPATLPPTTPPVDNTPASRPEEITDAPLPTATEKLPAPEPVAPLPEPTAPPPELIELPSEPVAPPLEPIAPPPEPSPIPSTASPE